MILTCPNCSARFMIDGHALGPGGRTVRCGACGHSWLQLPEPALSDQDATLGAPPSPALTIPRIETQAPDDAAEAPPPTIAAAEPKPETKRGRRRAEAEAAAAAAEGRRPRSGLSRILVWFLFVFIVAGIALGAYKYRNDVVRLWPPAMKLYEVLAIDVEPPTGLGLHVPQESLRFRREAEGGIPILVVSGEILNVSSRAQRVTPMRILLLDKENKVLRTERVKIDDRTLEPGKRLPFQTSIPNAPPEAAAVRITFDITG
jgi:predicted Zn finger-like uncharacterized protein